MRTKIRRRLAVALLLMSLVGSMVLFTGPARADNWGTTIYSPAAAWVWSGNTYTVDVTIGIEKLPGGCRSFVTLKGFKNGGAIAGYNYTVGQLGLRLHGTSNDIDTSSHQYFNPTNVGSGGITLSTPWGSEGDGATAHDYYSRAPTFSSPLVFAARGPGVGQASHPLGSRDSLHYSHLNCD